MKKYLLFISCVLLAACAPRSKADYMTEFGEFMTEVSDNYKTYSDRDWEKMDKKYQKFSGEWYNKFENELTVKDELKVASYQTKWAVYRNLDEVSSAVKEIWNSNEAREAKEGVRSYIENDMEDDIRAIENETKKLTQEIVKEAREVLEEINGEIK